MTITSKQQKIIFGVLIAIIVLLNGYRFLSGEKPKTAPLVYERGAVADSPVRHGLESRAKGNDPLTVFLARSVERYPGVSRNIFRMENPVVKPKMKLVSAVVVTAPPPPAVPERTAEEIAADLARADLSKFQFLGYLTDKESTLFLSKEGELFMVKKGDKLLKSYQVKDARKEYVLLLDTVTNVEVRVNFPGSEPAPQQATQQLRPQPPAQPRDMPQQQYVQHPVMQPPTQPQSAPPQSIQQPGPQPPTEPTVRRRLRPARPD